MTASRPIRHDYFFDSERKSRVRGRIAFAVIAVLGLVILNLMDRWLFERVYAGPDDLGEMESKAWYQILRQAGDIRTWLIVATAIGAHAFWRAFGGNAPRIRIGGTLSIAIAPIASGIVAEGARMVLARERPLVAGAFRDHVWQGLFAGVYSDGKWFQVSSLGLPSSHAAVAMAAAVAAGRAFPGTGWVLVPVAIGCAWTRMLSGRHFASDVFLGMLIGWLAGTIVFASLRRVR